MRLALIAGVVALAGCEPSTPIEDVAAPPPPERAVTVEADPPPPFTYWAPEGSVIVNHPNGEPVWIAQTPEGERLAYYFGDACGAAARQDWVGLPRSDFPDMVPSETVRIVEHGQAMQQDLRYNRLNVMLDAEGRITEVACH